MREGYASSDETEVLPIDDVLLPGEEVVLVGGRDLEGGQRVTIERAQTGAEADTDSSAAVAGEQG